MMKLSKIILKTFGWNLVGEFPDIKKSVVVMAPHTSYWDFVIGKLYLNAMGISNNTLMKKEMFIFPLNILMRALGAIPVDRRNKKNNMVQQVASIIETREKCNIFIAAEGTRKRNSRWKKGFYHIAKKANVPIVTSFVDYNKKEVGIKRIISDTSNIKSTMTEINNIYKDIQPKFPPNFSVDKESI
ncbi:MAG: glycerol acyltransferase [Bacteroidetes bacterium]|nr:MAG: glycerol acyltransferase [Bacteroidota bacterium]